MKKNSRVDILNRKSKYIKIKEIFNYSILKINKDRLLLAKKFKLSLIICIIKDD